jgi:hypothetical protein
LFAIGKRVALLPQRFAGADDCRRRTIGLDASE